MLKSARWTAALLIAASGGFVGSAEAGDGWTTDLTIYGWFTGIEGEIRAPAFGLGANGSLTPRDVLDNLEGALFAKLEAWNGRYGLVFDLVSADLGFDGVTPVPAPAAVRAETSLTMATAVLGWRVSQTAETIFDLFGGLRYVSFSVDATVGPPILVRGGVSENWVDPVIGLRAIRQLSPRFGVQGLVDVGGFGVGSDLILNAYAGGRYTLTENLTAEFGLRYIRIDYSTDLLDSETDFWGPALGLTYRF
jgi:hypothetical protein